MSIISAGSQRGRGSFALRATGGPDSPDAHRCRDASDGRPRVGRAPRADASGNERALYVWLYTDNAIVHHRVLEADVFFIQKPFSRDSLTRKVPEVLDAR